MASTKKTVAMRQQELAEASKARAIAARKVIFKPQYDVAIDWGSFQKGKLVGYDGVAWTQYTKPLAEVLVDLAAAGATSIVIEGSFGSFDLREVAHTLKVAASLDVVVGKLPTKQTERYRREVLECEDKSEFIDALCIFEIANHQSCHVAIAKQPSEEQIAKQDKRRSSHTGKALVLRSLGWPVEECKEFTKYLQAFVEPWVKDTYFWDEKNQELKPGWCIPVIAVALEVIENGGGRDDLDRRIGYNAFGYPSFFRSNFYYGMLSHSVKKRLGVKNRAELDAIPKADIKAARNSESTKHRRVCRWLFSHVRNRLALQSMYSAAA